LPHAASQIHQQQKDFPMAMCCPITVIPPGMSMGWGAGLVQMR
jgi:hypothetical protein